MDMARPLRITYPGAFYHITSRGNERKAVFKSKHDRTKFLEYLGSATERYGAIIHVYCLMDNHYHLLLETPSANLPQIMRHINGAYTTYFNVKRDRSGHLFRGRYKAILVEKGEYVKELSRYIHLNPVRANMVALPEEYEWSSYNQYVGQKEPEVWLARGFILGYFGKKYATAQKRYKDFVALLIGKDYESPLKEVFGSVLLGSQDFVISIKEQFMSGIKPSRDIPAARAIVARISMQEISDRVEQVFKDDPKIARKVKIYLNQKHTGEKLRTIGKEFGIGGSAVAQVCTRFKATIDKEKKLKKKVLSIEKKIKM